MLSCHGFLASMCVPNRLNVGEFTFCSRTFIRDYAFYAFVVDGFVGFISTPSVSPAWEEASLTADTDSSFLNFLWW